MLPRGIESTNWAINEPDNLPATGRHPHGFGASPSPGGSFAPPSSFGPARVGWGTPADVQVWLVQSGFPQHAGQLAGVNAVALNAMTEEDLRGRGIASWGERKKLLRAAKAAASPSAAAAPSNGGAFGAAAFGSAGGGSFGGAFGAGGAAVAAAAAAPATGGFSFGSPPPAIRAATMSSSATMIAGSGGCSPEGFICRHAGCATIVASGMGATCPPHMTATTGGGGYPATLTSTAAALPAAAPAAAGGFSFGDVKAPAAAPPAAAGFSFGTAVAPASGDFSFGAAASDGFRSSGFRQTSPLASAAPTGAFAFGGSALPTPVATTSECTHPGCTRQVETTVGLELSARCSAHQGPRKAKPVGRKKKK